MQHRIKTLAEVDAELHQNIGMMSK